MTLEKIVKMAVEIAAAMHVATADAKAKSPMGTVKSLLYTAKGQRNMQTKDVMVDAKKQPNMTCEASLIILRYPVTCVGRDTMRVSAGSLMACAGGLHLLLAPARSSLSKISTGLNQYSSCGLLQSVTPWLL